MRKSYILETTSISRTMARAGRWSIFHVLLAPIAVSAISSSIAYAQVPGTQTTQGNTASPAPSKIAPPSSSSVVVLNEVIVTGTRQTGTTARNSLTPITVISGKTLQETGQVTLRNALTELSPSIARQSMGEDASGLTDDLTLHGLSPNDVLVLVNGKRRHATANISLDAGPEQGSTGVDLDMIPVSAIDHIEILRGSASAQYGSDAIAGVINIILKSANHGGSIQSTEGQYYAGDGFSRDLAGNVGTGLGENGFLNLSFEYAGQDHTDRTGIDTRTGEFDNELLGDPASNRELLGFNTGYYLADGIEFYGFGTYGHRSGDGFENFRLGSVLPTVFPNGFSPRETIAENDFSVTGGVKGKNLLGWDWDLSSTYGGDYDNIGMVDSANTSFFQAFGYTPTAFHLENLSNTQLTNNLDFTRQFGVPVLPAPLHVSWGVEQQIQTYRIGAGDFASSYGTGAQALPGLAPLSAGTHYRHIVGTYIDLATNLTPHWKVDLAGRFEHYSDVGNTTNGELSTRYDFNPQIAVRASVGTAFQAPSLAEEYFTNLNVSPTSASGQLAADSAVAKSLGSIPLKPEKSKNYDLGLVLNPVPAVNLTVDAYQIDIDDRVVDGGEATGAAAISALSAAGITLQAGLDPNAVSASYFTNGANTRTRGVDITGNYLEDLQDLGSITWNLGANVNDTEVTKISNNASGVPDINVQQKHYLTSTAPKFKILFGGSWLYEKWGISLNETMYGPTTDELTYLTPGPNQYSSSVFAHFVEPVKFTTDIELRYRPIKKIELAVGASNLFNTYPKDMPLRNQYFGLKYDVASSQLGFDGGLYYIRARYVF